MNNRFKPSIDELKGFLESAQVGIDQSDVETVLNGAQQLLLHFEAVEGYELESHSGRPLIQDKVMTDQENAFGAWSKKFDLQESESGVLAGLTVAVKDNIAISGVRMSFGSRHLEHFVPDSDATVVAKVLESGARIAGTATCEAYCLSGGSHTSWPAPVRNPLNTGHTSGGSSSGSAVLVAAGEVDVALGTDQGGSIRVPSAWCGVYGMKPTFGLVSCTGVASVDESIDHVGPIARDLDSLARLLTSIAGPDGQDPRQVRIPSTHPREPDYTNFRHLELPAAKIGVLTEGFAIDNRSDPLVDRVVREAAALVSDSGLASTQDVSIPEHRLAESARIALMTEGAATQFWNDFGNDGNPFGLAETDYFDYISNAFRENSSTLPLNIASLVVAGLWTRSRDKGAVHARAKRFMTRLSAAYDEALAVYDVLLMPTVPVTAPPMVDVSAKDIRTHTMARSTGINTAPFNVTGHPAISVPCGTVGGLPVGLMLVSAHWSEEKLLKCAELFEDISISH